MEDIEEQAKKLRKAFIDISKAMKRYEPPEFREYANYSHSQIEVVMALFEVKKPSTMGDLERFTRTVGSALTRVVDRLVDEDMALRERDGEDRRVVRVSLTTKGKKIAESIYTAFVKSNVKILEQITPEERETFIDIIERISKSLLSEVERD